MDGREQSRRQGNKVVEGARTRAKHDDREGASGDGLLTGNIAIQSDDYGKARTFRRIEQHAVSKAGEPGVGGGLAVKVRKEAAKSLRDAFVQQNFHAV